MIGFSSSAISVFSQDELSVNEVENSSLIHMDVDQTLLPMSTPAKAAVFESFARQNVLESEVDVTASIRQLVKSNYGFSADSKTEFTHADFPLALFNKLVLCCIKEGGTFCFPVGSNGNYVAAAKFLNAKVVNIPTNLEEGFKLTTRSLRGVLESVKKPWIYISGPTVNPTGLLYSNEEMKNVLSICAHVGARVIIDTSSSAMVFSPKGWAGWNLDSILADLAPSNPSFSISLFGGLFLKMLTGGVTFGFLLLNASLVDDFYSNSGLSKPHSTIKYAVKKLLDAGEQEVGELVNGVVEQEKLLGSRFKRLKETLEKCGWEVLEAEAGLSMVAKPSGYLGKTIKIIKGSATWEAKLDDSNIREAMLRSTGLCINGPSWTGIPGYCRLTMALADNDFERALNCILKFKDIVGN